MYALDKEGGIVRDDGACIPPDPENTDYAAYLAWVAAGHTPTAYENPPPTTADVRAEAQRRIMILVGATDFNSCVVKQLNANMRATELTSKMGEELTESEANEAKALQAMAAAIKSIRARSNAMETNVPADYAADHRWALL